MIYNIRLIKKLMNRGFSMVELAIVMTISAIIAGIFISGNVILFYTQAQKLIDEFQQNILHIKSFRESHLGYMPGDLPIGNQYWSSADVLNICQISINSASSINGNGDRLIGNTILKASDQCSGELKNISNNQCEQFDLNNDESVLATCHMYLDGAKKDSTELYSVSGMMDGKMQKIAIPSIDSLNGGFVMYNSKLGEIEDSRNVLAFVGSNVGNETQQINGQNKAIFYPSISAASALYLDTKIDDGSPATGKIRSYSSVNIANTNCVILRGASTSQYRQYTEHFSGNNFIYNKDQSQRRAKSCLPQYIID